MNRAKKKRLQSRGWRIGNAAEFLDLSPEETVLIEIRLALAEFLKKSRLEMNLTQTQLAERLKSSQSRVAKMEGGDIAVSIDLLIRSLLSLGKSSKEVGRVIALETV